MKNATSSRALRGSVFLLRTSLLALFLMLNLRMPGTAAALPQTQASQSVTQSEQTSDEGAAALTIYNQNFFVAREHVPVVFDSGGKFLVVGDGYTLPGAPLWVNLVLEGGCGEGAVRIHGRAGRDLDDELRREFHLVFSPREGRLQVLIGLIVHGAREEEVGRALRRSRHAVRAGKEIAGGERGGPA